MMKCLLCERENPKVSDVITDGSWLCKRCGKKSITDGTHVKQVFDKDDVVMNNLLTYVSFYFSNSSSDAIKNVLRNFYHPKEVSDAKVLLWQVSKDALPPIVIRQDSDLRSAKEADIVDILNAFKKMDIDDVLLPEFVCNNMDRIPKYGPEEIDFASVVQRLTAMEDKIVKMFSIDDRVTQVERSVCKNDDSIKTLFSLYYQTNSMAAKLKPQSVDVNTSVSAGSIIQSTQPREPTRSTQQTDITSQKASTTITDNIQVPKPRDSQAVKSAATILVPDAGSENKADGDGFRYPSHVIRRQRRQAVYGNRARGVAGSFRGAPQTLDIFVFRCEKDVTCEKVKDYIEQNNINVLDIECISSSEARYRSFRVTLPKHARDDVMECNFWPDGVGVRVFRKKRTQFADNNSQDGR